MSQRQDRREWLNALVSAFDDNGVVAKIGRVHHKPSIIEGRRLPGGTYDLLRTLHYAEFVDEEDRWYRRQENQRRKKQVPRDLRLSALTTAHWFCGDGRGGDSKGTLGFCTNGFDVDDVEFLVERLKTDLGVHSILQLDHRHHPIILVGRRNEAMKLKKLVEDLLPNCFAYKLRHCRPLPASGRGRRLPPPLVAEIRGARFSTTYSKAAEKFGVSRSKVWKIWHEES